SLMESDNGWPHPQAVAAAYRAMPSSDRVMLCAMRPLSPVGTEFWPRTLKNGDKLDAFMEDIHAICANIYFGSKAAMARLSRAQLILMERDIARGMDIP